MHQNISVHVDEALVGIKEYDCKVLSNENVATFIKELSIELPEGQEVHYRPGGYMQFHVPAFQTDTSDWKKTTEEKYWDEKGKLINHKAWLKGKYLGDQVKQ